MITIAYTFVCGHVTEFPGQLPGMSASTVYDAEEKQKRWTYHIHHHECVPGEVHCRESLHGLIRGHYDPVWSGQALITLQGVTMIQCGVHRP